MTTPNLDEVLAPLQALNQLSSVPELANALRAFGDLAARLPNLDAVVARSEGIAVLRAAKLGGARHIDAAIKAGRARCTVLASDAGLQGRAVVFDEPEPWPEPVDGSGLVDDLVRAVGAHIVVSTEAAVAIALWVLHTHAATSAHCTPRLTIVSPVKRCGKTTLLRLLGAITARSLLTANISPAVLFRIVEAERPTLLIDEADAFAKDNEDLRGLINAGHARDGKVLRCIGDNHEPRSFAVFCPMAIAAIGRLPDTIMDRSVVVEMRRKTAGDKVQRLDRRALAPLVNLYRQCSRWAADHSAQLNDATVTAPSALNDRAADNWEPLLAIAGVAGLDWPARAVDAALALSGAAEESNSQGEMVLSDIRELLHGPQLEGVHVLSADLVVALNRLEDRPWNGLGKEGLTAHKLAKLLRPFGIQTSTVRIASKTPKAYARSAFADAFGRYLPPETATTATTATTESKPLPSHALAAECESTADELDDAGALPPVAVVAVASGERRVRKVF